MSKPAALAAALCFVLADDGLVPEWIELIPAPGADGMVRGTDSRAWRFGNAAAVAANFTRRLPVDINHSTEIKAPKGEESPAVGWIEELQARNGALWGRVAWTETGASALKGRDYRFVSPVFTYDRASTDIVRLTSAALVNNPNLPLALNSAGSVDPCPELAPMSLKAILVALKLADNATEADAVNAIHTLNTSLATASNSAQTPDLTKFVPRADHDAALGRAVNAETALNAVKTTQHQTAVNVEIDAAIAAGKVTPASREFYVATCATQDGLDKFKAFIGSQPVIVQPGSTVPSGQPGAGQAALTAEQKAMCSSLGIKEETFAEELKAMNSASRAS
ncbi:phage protease [Nevskia ramosa]|uniref:phage protease n=1 Tax=Nevskia ramosa TaxID=64002 RepID=UPI00235287B8|nr:phage protease [Nevskia ramosa]